jgi:hypothetical protein
MMQVGDLLEFRFLPPEAAAGTNWSRVADLRARDGAAKETDFCFLKQNLTFNCMDAENLSLT